MSWRTSPRTAGRARRDRRGGHARRRGAALRGSSSSRSSGSRSRSTTTWPRPTHVRVQPGSGVRDGRARPAAHDRRVAQPRDGRRGDGPAHGLDRGDERHRRRRRRDPDPGAPDTVEEACREIEVASERGKDFSIVVVSEGYELTYAWGERQLIAGQARHRRVRARRAGGLGDVLAREIEGRTGFETRVTVLGHVQRGGRRQPATGCSQRATASRRRNSSTQALGEDGRPHGDEIVEVSLREAVAELKTGFPDWYEVGARSSEAGGSPSPASPLPAKRLSAEEQEQRVHRRIAVGEQRDVVRRDRALPRSRTPPEVGRVGRAGPRLPSPALGEESRGAPRARSR